MARVLQGTAIATPTIRPSDLLSGFESAPCPSATDSPTRKRREREEAPTSEYERKKVESVSTDWHTSLAAERRTSEGLANILILEPPVCTISPTKSRA